MCRAFRPPRRLIALLFSEHSVEDWDLALVESQYDDIDRQNALLEEASNTCSYGVCIGVVLQRRAVRLQVGSTASNIYEKVDVSAVILLDTILLRRELPHDTLRSVVDSSGSIVDQLPRHVELRR